LWSMGDTGRSLFMFVSEVWLSLSWSAWNSHLLEDFL
jgi:hypothetical protein